MLQRNQDHNFMTVFACRRHGAALLMVLGLGLSLSGCSALGVFSVFGDFGDDSNDVVLIEEGDLSRQTLGRAPQPVPAPTTNAVSPLVSPPTPANLAPAPLVPASGTTASNWRPSDELRNDVLRYLGQLGPKAFAVTKPMPGGAQAWAFVHGRGSASEVQRDAVATCEFAAKEQSITNRCQLLFIDDDMQELGWP